MIDRAEKPWRAALQFDEVGIICFLNAKLREFYTIETDRSCRDATKHQVASLRRCNRHIRRRYWTKLSVKNLLSTILSIKISLTTRLRLITRDSPVAAGQWFGRLSMALKHKILGAMGAVALSVAFSGAAHADTTYNVNDASGVFTATSDANGVISASFDLNGLPAGTFTDTFQFRVPVNGTGTGSLNTSGRLNSANDLDFISVFVNGVEATYTRLQNGAVEFASITDLPVLADPFINQIVVTYTSRGNGAFSGVATFTPNAVPEAGTWAMMIMGLGAIGGVARRRQRNSASLATA